VAKSLSTEDDPVRALPVPLGKEGAKRANALFCPPVPWSNVLCIVPRAASAATLHALGEAVRTICRQKGRFPLFIALDSRRDIAVCDTLCRAVGQGSVIAATDEHALACALSRAHGTLSMRLHGLVLAAAGGGRAVALSYDERDPKLSTFAAHEGIPSLRAGASVEEITAALLRFEGP
jgi:polysaccharide pyruvyl transferase WcaK-like protein